MLVYTIITRPHNLGPFSIYIARELRRLMATSLEASLQLRYHSLVYISVSGTTFKNKATLLSYKSKFVENNNVCALSVAHCGEDYLE